MPAHVLSRSHLSLNSSTLQEVRAGFTWGQVRIARLTADEVEDSNGLDPSSEIAPALTRDAATMLIPFQNENLCAYAEHLDDQGVINREVVYRS